MASITKGDISRMSILSPGIPDRYVSKEDDDKKIKAPATGSLQIASDMSNLDAFIEAQEAAQESSESVITGKGPSKVDEFLNAVDDGSIDLSNLDYQVSAGDVPLQGSLIV